MKPHDCCLPSADRVTELVLITKKTGFYYLIQFSYWETQALNGTGANKFLSELKPKRGGSLTLGTRLGIKEW